MFVCEKLLEDKAYKIIKYFFRIHTYRIEVVKGKNGKIITEDKEKLKGKSMDMRDRSQKW